MNIGIVGTGSIAHTMAKEFARPTTMPVVAVCSRNADTGIAMAHEFHIPIPKVYTEYDEMLADSEVELVYIATPNSLHFEQAKAALLAGKHVLCEKPIVPTVAQLDELLSLAKSAICTCWRLLRPSTIRTMVWQSCLQRRLVTSRRYPAPSVSIPAGMMPL